MTRWNNYPNTRKNNKYYNKKVNDNGLVFDSKKEFRRFNELKILEKKGIIKELKLQQSFELIPTLKDNQGKTERKVVYKADFTYMKNNKKYVEDVKSVITRKNPTYIIKRKLFKERYPNYIFVEYK